MLSDPLKDSSRAQESWSAFLTKLRTLLLMSFTKNLGKFEDDMRTLREKRTEPGWSFCDYFMVQVRAASGGHLFSLLLRPPPGARQLALGCAAAHVAVANGRPPWLTGVGGAPFSLGSGRGSGREGLLSH